MPFLLPWPWKTVTLMYLFVFLGPYLPVKMPTLLGIPSTGVWTIILLAYGFIASILPITALLQPRDFINSHQLVIAMVLLILGVVAASFLGRLEMVAPALQPTPEKAPPMWPFLFITIACGAISGFHALVSSGTSAKQVRSEDDSLFVGYGSMLLEGALATLVIVAGIPAVFMAVMTLWAAVLNQFQFGSAHNLLLQSINVAIILIAAWILIEGVVKFFQTDETSDLKLILANDRSASRAPCR
jgi:carbon starvation protein